MLRYKQTLFTIPTKNCYMKLILAKVIDKALLVYIFTKSFVDLALQHELNKSTPSVRKRCQKNLTIQTRAEYFYMLSSYTSGNALC